MSSNAAIVSVLRKAVADAAAPGDPTARIHQPRFREGPDAGRGLVDV